MKLSPSDAFYIDQLKIAIDFGLKRKIEEYFNKLIDNEAKSFALTLISGK
jgi:hypothetical protein